MAYIMTATKFVEMAKKIEKTKTAYMWGTYGRTITQALITAKVKQYPTRYTAAYQSKLKTMIGTHYGWDCVGLIKGILWGWDGTKEVPYATNGVPDTNVMGFYQRGLEKSSDFSKILPGAAVHLPTHVGIYIGDGLVVEATSAWESCVMITALANIGTKSGYRSRKWDSWYKIPYVDYSVSTVTTPEPEAPQPSTGSYINYSVVKGDTPWGLAQKHLGAGARYTEIMAASGLPKDATIYVGQILKIPVKDQPPSAKPEETRTHLVVKGDTPWGLAAKYLGSGQRYPEIMQLNDLAEDANIFVGQILKIPAKAEAAPKPPVFQPYSVRVNTKNGLNVRDGPSTANKILRVFCNGTLVMIDEEKSGWGYVASVKGWISLDFTVKA